MPDRDLVRRDRPPQPATTPKGTNYLLAIAINDYQYCTKLNNAVVVDHGALMVYVHKRSMESTCAIILMTAEMM